MSKKKPDQSGFRRRMGRFRDGFFAVLFVAAIGFVFVVGSFLLSSLARGTRIILFEELFIAGSIIGFVLIVLGILGMILLTVFAITETGASGIDWVFGRMEQGTEKSKRKVKSDE